MRNERENEERDLRSGTEAPKIWRTIFGIFMIIIYLGMAVLMMTGFFGKEGVWLWLRWVGGGILAAYGVWRGYRQFIGIN